MTIDLNFIAKQLERVLAEQAAFRDEMLVLGARMDRLEAGFQVITLELRSLGNQIARMNDRIVKLEEAAP